MFCNNNSLYGAALTQEWNFSSGTTKINQLLLRTDFLPCYFFQVYNQPGLLQYKPDLQRYPTMALCALQLEDECHGNDSIPNMSYLTVSIAFLLMILNIPGNLLEILAVALDPYKKLRTPFNFMMTNLAVADLVVGVVTVPMSIYIHWKEGMGEHVTLGELRVLFMSYFISCTASLLSLATLAVERYLAIR